MLNEQNEYPYIDVPIGDARQHIYVESRVQFAPPSGVPWETADTWTVSKLISDHEIEVEMDGATEQVVDISANPVRVLEISDEIRAEEMSKERIAPFHLDDDYGYADEEYFWTYAEANDAAVEFAEENQCDVRIVNAYSNDVELVEYEEPESEEEESDDEDDTPL